MTTVKLKYISGRTTEQETGRNCVVEGSILYVSPIGYTAIENILYCTPGNFSMRDLTITALRHVGVTDDELMRCLARGLSITVDHDMVDYV